MTYVYLFGGILLVLVVAVVASALRQARDESTDEDGAPAEARRDAALETLRELEFEYRTGKLPDEEYRRLRRRYGRMALAARAEAEGGASPAGTMAPPAGPPDGPPAACPSCGASLGPEDRFCSRCGARRA